MENSATFDPTRQGTGDDTHVGSPHEAELLTDSSSTLQVSPVTEIMWWRGHWGENVMVSFKKKKKV